MTAVRVNNYRDFQRLVAASDRVFYFFDKKDSCFLYGVSGIFKDWVATTNVTDHDGNAALPKSFHEDYPTATPLDGALTILPNQSAADGCL
jgi:hypothetical protein